MTGSISIRVHGLDRIDDPRVEDRALDGNALITDWPGARVDCPERFDRGGTRDLRERWAGEERDRQQPKGGLSSHCLARTNIARLDDLPVKIILERFYERLVHGDAIAPLQPQYFHVLSP
jgi:hypothetical protein